MTIPRAEPDVLDQAAVLALTDPAAEWKYRRALCREAYDRGHLAGYHQGYEQAVRDLERNWQVVAKKVKKGASGPTHAELETVRYGPGGREHFSDPRPGDFAGTGDIARPAPPRRAWLHILPQRRST